MSRDFLYITSTVVRSDFRRLVCHDVVRSGLPDGILWVYNTVYNGYMYGTLLVFDLSISFLIFIVVVFSWLFLRHDGYINLWSIVCCETDSGFKVLENDVG